jgi:hypothetical protein
MRNAIQFGLLMGAALVCFLSPRPVIAQVCKDEEAMVGNYQKSVGDLVQTVKKESLTDFERAYHQRGGVTKLSLWLNVLDGLESCLTNASQETTTTKEQADGYKAKLEAITTLKVKIQHDRDELKAAAAAKDAKAVVEKIDYANG